MPDKDDIEEIFTRLRAVEQQNAVQAEKSRNQDCAIEKILKDVCEMKDKLLDRMPTWATILIGGLMSICTGLVVYVTTH